MVKCMHAYSHLNTHVNTVERLRQGHTQTHTPSHLHTRMFTIKHIHAWKEESTYILAHTDTHMHEGMLIHRDTHPHGDIQMHSPPCPPHTRAPDTTPHICMHTQMYATILTYRHRDTDTLPHAFKHSMQIYWHTWLLITHEHICVTWLHLWLLEQRNICKYIKHRSLQHQSTISCHHSQHLWDSCLTTYYDQREVMHVFRK